MALSRAICCPLIDEVNSGDEWQSYASTGHGLHRLHGSAHGITAARPSPTMLVRPVLLPQHGRRHPGRRRRRRRRRQVRRCLPLAFPLRLFSSKALDECLSLRRSSGRATPGSGDAGGSGAEVGPPSTLLLESARLRRAEAGGAVAERPDDSPRSGDGAVVLPLPLPRV